jgi:hypothetical protein
LAVTVNAVSRTTDKAVSALNVSAIAVVGAVAVITVTCVGSLKVCLAVESSHILRGWALRWQNQVVQIINVIGSRC